MAAAKAKLLAVDDESKNLHVLRRILDDTSVEIVEALSGQEALRALLHHDFFLILMDVQMPRMNGFETAKLIFENPKTSHIPIIFLTALSKERSFISQGYRSGAVDYIYKPADPEVLCSKVKIFQTIWEQRIELQQKNSQLNHLNAELEKTTKALERSNGDLQDFASVASHDMRAPLRHISTFSQAILDDDDSQLSQFSQATMGSMISSSTRLANMLENLLVYARSGNSELHYCSVDLNDIVRESMIDLQESIDDSKAIINTGNLLTIEAEPLQLYQVIQNLISNAIKFQAQGNIPEIIIHSRILPPGDDGIECCQIDFSDNGIGFEQSKLDTIFTPFRRLVGRSEYEGSGIGLSTAMKIIERHQGTITATSKVGEGSTFSIVLPVKKPQQ